MLTLKELVRNYNNLVEDSTKVMLRIKAIFARERSRRRACRCIGSGTAEQSLAKLEGGAREASGVADDAAGRIARAASEGKGVARRLPASAPGRRKEARQLQQQLGPRRKNRPAWPRKSRLRGDFYGIHHRSRKDSEECIATGTNQRNYVCSNELTERTGVERPYGQLVDHRAELAKTID